MARWEAPDDFAQRAAHYVNEINAAHPFVEGNGCTQRVWLRNLAERAVVRSSHKTEFAGFFADISVFTIYNHADDLGVLGI